MKRILLSLTPFPGRMPDAHFHALDNALVESIRAGSPLRVRPRFVDEALSAIGVFLRGLVPEREATLLPAPSVPAPGPACDYALSFAGSSRRPDGPFRTAVSVRDEAGLRCQDFVWQDPAPTPAPVGSDEEASAIALTHALTVARSIHHRTGTPLRFRISTEHAGSLAWITGRAPVTDPRVAVAMLRAGLAEELLQSARCGVAFAPASAEAGMHSALLCARARAAETSVPFKLERFRKVCAAAGLVPAEIWGALKDQEVNYTAAEILGALHRVGVPDQKAMRIVDSLLLKALGDAFHR